MLCSTSLAFFPKEIWEWYACFDEIPAIVSLSTEFNFRKYFN